MPDVHADLAALGSVIVLLAVGIAAAIGARAARLSPIVGYLAAGMTIGPNGLEIVAADPTLRLLAELGVVFLLFDIGLHFSPAHIWSARRDIFGHGSLQVALNALGLGIVASLAGLPPLYAVIVGTTLALSSTAVVARIIAERHQQNCPVGTTATAVLIFQDVVAIFLLILATSIGGGGGSLAVDFAAALGKAAAAFAAALAVGRFAVRPLFDMAARTENEDVFTALALLVVLVAASATGAIGLSLTLGAFLGGMIISETSYRPAIQSEINGFRRLLLGFFFISVGMTLDPALLVARWPTVVLLVAALVGAKLVLNAAASLALRWSIPGSVQLGFLLAQGSEFAFVILSLAEVRAGLGNVADVLIAAVAASLALTPTLATLGRRLAGRLRQRHVPPATETTPLAAAAPVLVVGMGAVGRTVADALTAFDIGYEAVERDHRRFASANADGYRVAFGDAADLRLWEPMGMGDRAILVLTYAHYEVSAPLSPITRERYPQIVRFVPVATADEAARFAALGMRPVIERGTPLGVDLADAVLRHHGIDDGAIEAWRRLQRSRLADAAGASAVA